ncbi:porin [Aliarcobacter skirrowii]|uniref:porin n=1 Tax=Aliarcobacter skirrowii TaxID=28200 RepID=UPI0029A31A25|nr:major outer membrane protein [Aliarcobacter skirrowii]MDX4064221.1 porin [Aliarcobacter skirrowii]
MKKFTKLSLVAAVAVAGLTSANAKPLEEAIKDVDVSGSVVYRYNDYRNDSLATNKSTTDNNYKIGLNLSSKVNDYVKFNSRFVVGTPDIAGGTQGLFGGAGFASLPTQTLGDGNPEVRLTNAYFGLTAIPNTTVNVGKMGLATPWTVAIDSDGGEQTGTGVLALSTVGPVTVAAGYFNQTNLDSSGDVAALTFAAVRKPGSTANIGASDIATAAVLGNFGIVNVDAWYLNLADVFDSYTIGAEAKFDLGENSKVGLEARYVQLNPDNNAVKDQSLTKFVATGKFGIINAKVAYATTDKDGGTTAIDNDSKATLLGWNLNANNKADADYYQLVLGVDILDNLNLSANYGNIEWKPAANVKREQEEIYAQLVYKMSKNLNTYVRYGTFTDDNRAGGVKTKINDDTRGRLQVEYTF